MSWVTWRQHRTEAIAAAIIWAVIAILLVITGLSLAEDFQAGSMGNVQREVTTLNIPFLLPIYLLPLLLGMFIGAPLVALETEHGTYQLAWTQGITRQAWLRGKLGLAAGVTVLLFTLLALFFAWWNLPVNAAIGPWQTFDSQGPVGVAYALFGLALGAALGALLKKTLPAMALTIPIFLAVRGLVLFARQYFLPPLASTLDNSPGKPVTLDWVLQQTLVDKFGHILDYNALKVCQDVESSKQGLSACYQAHGFFLHIIYQPVSRFWTFQGIETAIFLLLAAGLTWLTFRLVRRIGE